MFIEAGSTINLTCIIQADSMRDSHIYWNYDGKVSRNQNTIYTTKKLLTLFKSRGWDTKKIAGEIQGCHENALSKSFKTSHHMI